MTFGANKLQNFHSSFSLSILISEITKFHFQSSEFHHDGIHIPVYSLSLIADRSSHSFKSKRAALWDFEQLFPSSEFFDNPG